MNKVLHKSVLFNKIVLHEKLNESVVQHRCCMNKVLHKSVLFHKFAACGKPNESVLNQKPCTYKTQQMCCAKKEQHQVMKTEGNYM